MKNRRDTAKKTTGNGKQKALQIIFHLALVFELAVFQFAWPLSVAQADTASTDPPAQEQTTTPDNGTAADNATKSDPSVNTDATAKSNTGQENPEDLWKTCKLSDLFDQVKDEKNCDECKKKTTCDDIEICLKEEIKIENDANIDNSADTTADTGGNEINLKEARPVRDTSSSDTVASDQNTAPDVAVADQSNSESTQPEAAAGSIVENNNSGAAVNDQNPAAGVQDQSDRSREADRSRDGSGGETNGENSQKDPSAQIASGDAVAVSDVVNEVNTNIVGSNGEETVQNIEGNYTGDINLLDSFNSLLENGKIINESNKSAFDAAQISIENKADVNNDVTTTANTGQNEIDNENEKGTSTITTGDAIAVANVVNIVNNNIIGNNFLFAVINVFGNWVGDLIVPGEGLLSAPQSGQSANLIIDANNNSNIENNIETSATSGKNEIESEGGDASAATGDAYADNVVTNQVGSTVVKNNWFFLAINNMGKWVGNVLNWNSEKNGYDTVFSFDIDENDTPSGNLADWFTKIFVRNEANVENNVTTTANTGENEIDSEGGAASIKTGNAYAFSKIMNLVNNNFIGNNWMFAVVNVFGSWKGNVEFAYPDLSVALGDSAGKVKKGDSFAYKITYKNNGHADCADVKVGVSLPDSVEYQSDTSGKSADHSGNEYGWTLSGLKPGEEKSFDVAVSLKNTAADDLKVLESQAAVATDTKEVELGNNVSSDQIDVYTPAIADNTEGNSPSNGQNNAGNLKHPALAVTRTVSKEKIEVGEITKHTIIAQNTGDTTLKNVVINDKVTNKKGDAGDYSWNVEKLEPGKKAVINYKLMVNVGAPTGDYKNKSVAWGFDENDNEVRSNEAGIQIAVSSIKNEASESYYYTYYTYSTPESDVSVFDGESGLIPTAKAATDEIPGKVLGDWSNLNGICRQLPWWGWLFAGIVYLTVIHWSLLRQKKIIKPVKD